ncbi:MAG: FAD-dependent oxidoreductase [Candidatus Aenigmarchaeota archaeon]|nr:FAD-dependent oxidoreductase [Candidatus Aenigmarchaeota archaeon]NIP40087.1 FAD-dependent oxidoreductase [Candidatus Aenigmarchaeota archaeon]NIQ18164.1 FAD-dependent oxidoreductase [Candidatus Aenigmarchaeota archaeon]NIS72921.1 FAD-dependent oxidoreductase [Candidatus Aenigmarchaeota archaeon]
MVYDVIIVGGGPAGLSAVLTACYLKLKHLVIEASRAGGILERNYPWKEVDSFIGFYEHTGKEVADSMVNHVKKEGAKIKEGELVEEITKDKKKRIFTVKTDRGKYQAKTVLLTTGSMGIPRRLEIPGEDNRNVYYSILDPKRHKGKKALVVGGGDTALEGANTLSRAGAKVWLVHRRDKFRAMEKNQEELKKSKAKVLFNTELKKIFGTKEIKKVTIFNNKTKREDSLEVDEVFIFIGSVFDVELFKKLGVRMEGQKVPVDSEMRTNVEGVFAAGDITGRLKRIPEAIGEGHLAVYTIYKYLKRPYWA